MKTADPVVVRFEGVSKTYDGSTLVVRDLTLEVLRGEFLTLLGPSGSGKTTCLMMLAGFESVTTGRISLNGRPINNLPPYRRGIGVVFQNYALFPHMTVFQNVAFPLTVRKRPKGEIRERVARVLETVRLPELGDRRPTQLSGGQQQRVAVARALIFEPQLVLMDEPLGALDKQLREQMQLEIKHLHESLSVTVVYVTHDQTEALTMSDRIAVLNHGRIEQLDTPAGLYEEPKTAFVAQFVGENNEIRGVIEERSGDRCRVRVAGGSMIRARAVSDLAAGEPTILSLRPERIVVDPPGRDEPNRFTAEVAEIIYQGDQVRCRLSVSFSDSFNVKLTNDARRIDFQKGKTVTVGWDWSDCRALPAAATT